MRGGATDVRQHTNFVDLGVMCWPETAVHMENIEFLYLWIEVILQFKIDPLMNID